MTTQAQRIKQLAVGGIWEDQNGNSVEIVALTKTKVKFKVLYIDDHQPKNVKAGSVKVLPMEDREETMTIDSFTKALTGFTCLTKTGHSRGAKNF